MRTVGEAADEAVVEAKSGATGVTAWGTSRRRVRETGEERGRLRQSAPPTPCERGATGDRDIGRWCDVCRTCGQWLFTLHRLRTILCIVETKER